MQLELFYLLSFPRLSLVVSCLPPDYRLVASAAVCCQSSTWLPTVSNCRPAKQQSRHLSAGLSAVQPAWKLFFPQARLSAI
jgi:hypothetical protein